MTWRKSGIIEWRKVAVGKEEVMGMFPGAQKAATSNQYRPCSGVGCQGPMRPKPIVVPNVEVVEGELQPR